MVEPERLGLKVAKQCGMARAWVAVARKLAVILLRVWSENTDFRFGTTPDAAPAPTAV